MKKEYPNPTLPTCKNGKYHHIGWFTGVCSVCKKQFWDSGWPNAKIKTVEVKYETV